MNLSIHTLPTDTAQYKSCILNFLEGIPDGLFLDSNRHVNETTGPHDRYDYIAAFGVADSITADPFGLDDLQKFIETHQQLGHFVFGAIAYDFKNNIEKLTSGHEDATGFPLFHFFVARQVITAAQGELKIYAQSDAAGFWNTIRGANKRTHEAENNPVIRITHMPERKDYMNAFRKLQHHIQQGDIYEINYCHQVKCHTGKLNPVASFTRLTGISPNPFSAYFGSGGKYVLCSSPERFMAKRGHQLISQPIKGTAPRDADPVRDALNREQLKSSSKERAENIMIVDLVRNDMSKVAQTGSVKVDELCGLYTFPKVHHLISTVSCTLKSGATFSSILKALFPMGSMTGAPKISAMKLIEKYENFKRSIFSGTIGYIDPDGDFDFNVVIRAIVCNQQNGALTLSAGSAITAASDPEKEYAETYVKLAPQLEALGMAVSNPATAITNGQVVTPV